MPNAAAARRPRWVSDSTCLSCRNISCNSIGTYNKRLIIKHQTTRRRRNQRYLFGFTYYAQGNRLSAPDNKQDSGVQ